MDIKPGKNNTVNMSATIINENITCSMPQTSQFRICYETNYIYPCTLSAGTVNLSFDSGTVTLEKYSTSNGAITLKTWTATLNCSDGTCKATFKPENNDYGEYWYKCKANANTSHYNLNTGIITMLTIDAASPTIQITTRNAQVTFDPNGGTINSSSSPVVKYARKLSTILYSGPYNTTSASVPTAFKPGYPTNGWFSQASGGDQILNANGSFYSTYGTSPYTTYAGQTVWVGETDETLYAQYGDKITYTVTPYDGFGNVVSDGTFYYKWDYSYYDGAYRRYFAKANLSNPLSTDGSGYQFFPKTPSKTDYTFQGYYTGTKGTGTKVSKYDTPSKIDNSFYNTWHNNNDSNVKIYANWSINPPATPTISGGTTKVYNSSSTPLTCSTTTTYSDSNINLYYQFGYADSEGGTITWLDSQTTSNVYVVPQNEDVGKKYYYCRVQAKDNNGYTSGTYSSSYGTGSGKYTELTINNTTITFNVASNGGTLSGTSPLYSKYGIANMYTGISNTTTATIPTASKTGYTFSGWYTAASGGSKVINADKSTVASVSNWTDSNKKFLRTANSTLYAQFTPNTYTITLDNQGAETSGTTKAWYQYNTSKTINNVTCYYYSNSALSTCLTDGYKINVPNKKGYTFKGYYTEPNGGGTKYVNDNGSFTNNIYKKMPSEINSNNTTNITLYAYYEVNTYKIILNNQSANTSGTTEVWYQFDTVKVINEQACYYYTDSLLTTCLTNYTIIKPEKTNYVFAGYYTETNGNGTQYVNLNGRFTNNIYKKIPSEINNTYTDTITLYANYEETIKEAYLVSGSQFTASGSGIFRRATEEEFNSVPLANMSIISINESPYPVYAFQIDHDMLYYTEADVIYMNPDSSNMFRYSEFTSIDLSGFDTSLVTNMSGLFSVCESLEELNLSGWDTSQVTDMSDMFSWSINLEEIIGIEDFNTSNVTNMSKMFKDDRKLSELNLNGWSTSQVTDMSRMFDECNSLEEIDMSSWDTSNVTDMSEMFINCDSLTELDLSNFNTSNVTNMYRMFMSCNLLEEIDISGFNTNSNPSTQDMFSNIPYLRTIYATDSFDNSKITNSDNMFYEDYRLVGYYGKNCLGSYDKTYAKLDTTDPNNRGYFTDPSHKGETNIITYPDGTVEIYPHNYTLELNDLPDKKVEKPADKVAEITFRYHDNVTDDTTLDVNQEYYQDGWTDGNEIYYSYSLFIVNTDMIFDYNYYPGEITTDSFPRPEREGYSFAGWYTEEDGGERIYSYASTENITLHAHWTAPFAKLTYGYELSDKISSIASSEYEGTYDSAINFRKGTEAEYNLVKDDLTEYNIISSEDSGELVYAWRTLTDVLYYSKTDNIFLNEDCSSAFAYLSLETIDLSELNPINVTSMNHMFGRNFELKSVNFGDNFDTSNVTDMSNMFAGDSALESVPFGKQDTSNVIDMSSMFQSCESLTSIDMSRLDFTSLMYASGMFANCTSLTSLKLSRKPFSNIRDAYSMFGGCSSLEELSLITFDTSNIESISSMFNYDSSLRTIYVSDFWDTNDLSYGYDVFYGDNNLVGEKGTTYDSEHTDYEYAIVDDAPDHPGYLTHADVHTVTYPDGTIEYYRDGETLSLEENNYSSECQGIVYVWLDYNLDDGSDPLLYDVCINDIGNGWLINDTHYDDNASLIVNDNIVVNYDLESSIDPVILPQDLERDGYEFAGWYIEDTKWEKEVYDEVADAVITAHWVSDIDKILTSVLYVVADKTKEDQSVDRIVIGAESSTTVSDFKDNMDNPDEFIKIYDQDDNLLSDDAVVTTGSIIKLDINGTVFDEAIIIVRGDINGDGLVNLQDRSLLADHLLRITDIEGFYLYAADINSDNSINLQDRSLLADYLLRIIDTLNE